jgi:hypothetical protein
MLGRCLSLGLLAALVSCAADDEGPRAPAGTKPGSERWVVFFTGDGPSLDDYRKAQGTGADLAPLEARLRTAAARHTAFGRQLAGINGQIVDVWWLTNAVTVELPAGAVDTLKELDGVARVAPEQVWD